MKRHYEGQLETWLHKRNRKPLVIRGARQVGKSTLVRQFAAKQGLRLFEVNVERHPHLSGVAETLDPQKILSEIEFVCSQGAINAADSIVFIDEIQAMPKLLQCLRYFYEEMPRLAVLAAGSLLEFALQDHSFPMPVGRIEYFHMGPVSWEEFLEAKNERQLLALLQGFELSQDFPVSAHERLLGLLREYFLVGGMPEAVQLHADGEPMEGIIDVQNSILQTYRDDFSKYATGRDLLRLQRILDYLGEGLGAKVKYVNIDRESQSRELKSALDLIVKAGVVLKVMHTHGDGIPLKARLNPKVFKLYSLDLGLYNRICGLNHIGFQQMRRAAFVNEGMLAEQFVVQQLFFRESPKLRPDLHYWLREGSSSNAEVDCLLQIDSGIVPVEVKSGKSGSLKSLLQFSAEKKTDFVCRFDLNPPFLQACEHIINGSEVRFKLLSLPLYFCNQIDRLVRLARP